MPDGHDNNNTIVPQARACIDLDAASLLSVLSSLPDDDLKNFQKTIHEPPRHNENEVQS